MLSVVLILAVCLSVSASTFHGVTPDAADIGGLHPALRLINGAAKPYWADRLHSLVLLLNHPADRVAKRRGVFWNGWNMMLKKKAHP